MEIVGLKRMSLKESKSINERKIQDWIAEHPECLELGQLVLKDRERPVQSGGFIDLLFQAAETGNPRYIVEVQLGDVDPSHMVRTADYVMQETRRFPKYDNVGVLVAENVTTCRFADFLQDFAKKYKLIVFQLMASEIDGKVCLDFVKTIDGRLSDVSEDIDVDTALGEEPISRAWYETKYGKDSMKRVDIVHEMVLNEVDSNVDLNYKKNYIGLHVDGLPKNWCTMWPHKNGLVDVGFKHTVDDKKLAEFKKFGLDAEVKKVYGSMDTVVHVGRELDEDHIVLMQELAKESRGEYFD